MVFIKRNLEGYPDNLYDMGDGHENSMVVLDDLMSRCGSDERMSDLFTCSSHSFSPGKLSCTISLNSRCMLIFRYSYDSPGIATIVKQMFPKNNNYLLQQVNLTVI